MSIKMFIMSYVTRYMRNIRTRYYRAGKYGDKKLPRPCEARVPTGRAYGAHAFDEVRRLESWKKREK